LNLRSPTCPESYHAGRETGTPRPLDFQIGEAVTFAGDGLVMVDVEERRTGMLRQIHVGEDGIDLAIKIAIAPSHLSLPFCPWKPSVLG
jgi:hypothetical protein